jgi:hypothetical protein
MESLWFHVKKNLIKSAASEHRSTCIYGKGLVLCIGAMCIYRLYLYFTDENKKGHFGLDLTQF